SFAKKLLTAEATNLQLSTGMALAGAALPGAQAMEKGLDLSLSLSKGLPSNDKEIGSPFAFAFAGAGSSLEASPASTSKELLLSLDSPMASLGGGLKRKDFPYSVTKVFEKEGSSLDIKLLSRKPIQDKNQAALKFAEAFLTLLASGAEEKTLQGAVASQINASAELRSFLLSPMKKVSLQFDLDGAEILTLRVFKDDLRMDFSVPNASQW